jgi:magnesium transporter
LAGENETTPPAGAPEAENDIYGEDGVVRADFLAHVGAAIADRDTLTLKHDVGALHQSELGDVLEALLPEQRLALVQLLGKDFDFTALTEVDEAIRLEIVDQLPNAQIAEAVKGLDSDDAVYILEDLDQEDQDEILAQLPFTERVRLRRALAYPKRRPAGACRRNSSPCRRSGRSARRSTTCARTRTCPSGSARSSSSIRPSSCWAPSTWTRCCALSAR